MERLEAALAKAREMRRDTLGQPVADRVRPVPTEAPGRVWADLPEVTIPSERARTHRISTLTGGMGAAPYDLLRSRAIRQMKEREWTRLAVTSPDPGCGKTTISINLALSLSRQKDLRVMLLDIDLRRPGINKVLGAAGRRSAWEVLDGKAGVEDAAVRIGDNLLILGNASSCPNPSELLQSDRTKHAIDQIETEWKPDIMLFDMSPMLASDDNVGFLGNVDCALLVAAAEHTRMGNIDLCEKELAGLTNVLGVVLNKCRYEDDSVGYQYGNY
jgi:capsular exopolysaccharide synthesis family protein